MRPVEQTELADVWQWARAGVEQIIKEQGLNIIAEDVYVALRGGQAWMFTVEADGFVILQRHVDVDGSGTLFIWMTWGHSGEMRQHYEAAIAELEGMARKANCARLRMWSNRRGWQRAGWTLKAYVYEREII